MRRDSSGARFHASQTWSMEPGATDGSTLRDFSGSNAMMAGLAEHREVDSAMRIRVIVRKAEGGGSVDFILSGSAGAFSRKNILPDADHRIRRPSRRIPVRSN